ncbi:MAG: hypothetical protein LKE46_04315 [Clostridium sp.]|jgi:hypothetical protein|uniref:hypothetical protein n=1 Tax=Clostridium sp. TaxID=1506 RepID=UPI0025C2F66E|nr:hypothetical protein [Clostridium sp.]MCH3963474.1 hypothetical protein [Clostridium sp.]MCI1714615.1 hypothetical protein [Clostridium sp.]MCI1799196.1 hypothetical protein [Clostridium sp.]MCI1812798.1 hypothetical protein [Clostridium sp.]MCI1869688.1 hypothetical protein [Clostridium sp.]
MKLMFIKNLHKIKKYKNDFFCLSLLTVLVLLWLKPIYASGQIVFSDIDFGFSSSRYLNEIFGAWNERWSSATLLNVPRLVYILPFYILSMVFDYSGEVFIKSFLTVIILSSGFSMYFFTRRLMRVYFAKEFNFIESFALIAGAFLYTLNPWVIVRIQHIYLLCGYGLFPLVFLSFFNAFDPNFQKYLIEDYDVNNPKLYRRNIYDLFMLSSVFLFSAAAIHYFFYGVIFLFCLLFLILVKLFAAYLSKREYNYKNIIVNLIYKILLFGLFFILTNAYWLSMYVFSILLKAQVTQHNVNVVDTYFMFGRHSSIQNIIYLISYWWPMFDLKSIPKSFYLGGGTVIAVILFTALFKGYRNNIILFFIMASIVCLILSTGMNIDAFSQIFIFMTDLPVIGSIFRDPNKLDGLMLMGFCVILNFGLQLIISNFKDKSLATALNFSVVAGVIVCIMIWINPYYVHYIKGFYSPVKEPKEYSDLQNKLEDKNSYTSKVLYLPTSEDMIQPESGIATPYWNVNGEKDGMLKATGDIHMYSSQKNTIFQYEGNSVNIKYYMNFLQYLMDFGKSHNIGQLVSAFGVNEFVYNSEYLGQEIRQKFNKYILDLQSGLQKKYENKISTLYEIKDSIGYLYNVPKKIYTPYGLSRLESYLNMPNFNFNDYGVIFSSIDRKSYIETLNKGDYIEASSVNDLLLSNLSKDDYLLPFDFVDSANAFLNWAKTMPQNNDWLWFLESQGIDNFPFDFDYNSGVVFTFASNKLEVPANKVDTVKGKPISDFKKVIDEKKFFVADNPENFKITASPASKAGSYPVVHGEIAQGESDNIWEVAKLGILDAKENNPYRFRILASGTGVNKMHFKVKFYDKNMKELNSNYIARPSESSNFKAMDFRAAFVSPPKTRYMRLELLSYKNSKKKAQLDIHNINIDDLEEYKGPNTFTIDKNFRESADRDVYMRAFVSSRGGKLKVTIGGKSVEADTYDKSMNQFQWINLGKFHFNSGSNEIIVQNESGFNAVNVFSLVSEDEYNSMLKKVKAAVNKSNIFCFFEAENDFTYTGNIQSDRVFPKLSLGKGISSQNGVLERKFDVLKSGSYSFALNASAYKGNNGHIKLTIQNLDNNKIISKVLNSSAFNKNSGDETYVIDKDGADDSFRQVLKKVDGEMDYYNQVGVSNVYLEKGKYKIEIVFDSKVPFLSELTDIHQFDHMETSNSEMNDNTLYINFKKGKSQDWKDYASKKMPVREQGQYLLRADLISKNIKNRHMKITFFDENSNIISVKYIDDVEENFKSSWNSYEQILTAPKDAEYMQFHILCRKNEAGDGYIAMKNYGILDYSQLICVDNLIMYEGNNYNEFFTRDLPKKDMDYRRIDSMKRNFKIDNPQKENVLVNYIESPTPLWNMSIEGKNQRDDLILNGVTSGFMTDGNGEGEISIILRKIYYASFVLMAVSFILFIMFMRR